MQMKKRLKEERASMAVYVTIVLLSFMMILSGIYFSSTSVRKSQLTTVLKIKEAYESNNPYVEKIYQNQLAKLESIWEYDQTSQTVTNGRMTLNIGDYVNYDPQEGATTTSYTSEQAKNGYGDQTFTLSEYTYGWRVLGVDKNKQLLLIAEEVVPLTGGYTDSISGRTLYYLGNDSDVALAQAAYVNGVDELNNICAIYGQGKGAIGARSVNVNDINNITGYDPETAEYNSGKVNEYGNEVTYTLTNGVVNYVGTKYPTESTTSTYTSFTYYTGSEWKTLSEGESATLRSICYAYYPNTLTDSTAYKMLFTNSSTGAYSASSGTTSEFYYWLASSYVRTHEGSARFGRNAVYKGSVDYSSLCYSYGLSSHYYRGVRPVVTLSPDVQLIDSGTDRDGCDLYNIK